MISAAFSPVCTENLIRIDCVTESPNVNGDDRALLPLPDPVRLAIQVEEPTWGRRTLLDDGRQSNKLSRAGSYGIPVVSERRFLEWMGKAVPDSLNRTYSAEQMAALSKLARKTIDQLVRFGLLDPREGLFGFRDLASARQIAKLFEHGIALSEIIRSVNEVRGWLPEADLSNLRLHPATHHDLEIEQPEGRTDKRGQFVLPVRPPEQN